MLMQSALPSSDTGMRSFMHLAFFLVTDQPPGVPAGMVQYIPALLEQYSFTMDT